MGLEFDHFDSRGYERVSASTGYAEWAGTYEHSVLSEMDLGLLSRLEAVRWDGVDRAADLGCGTGRTGLWLRQHGVTHIDGIDITPQMIARARQKNIYDHLSVRDLLDTGLDDQAYTLVAACLVDEHVRDLGGLYREASRILRPHGCFVLVGYHPQFIMTTGMPTHYHRADGTPVAIETHVHLFSDHVAAALDTGLELREMLEGTIDEAWLHKKPKWRRHLGLPISFAMVWRRGRPTTMGSTKNFGEK